ncbi:callose synthase 7-like isoform X2 [Arachis hypogaea]|uniref:callose synthase 7-like isoform X2 n=1 Tax=Arachis hypogaea TaxID=3818 RepID=UPI003B21721A
MGRHLHTGNRSRKLLAFQVLLHISADISTNSFISLNDSYMYSAVVECYETLKDIIYNLLQDEEDKMSSMYCDRIVSHICDKVEWSIQEHTFVKEFKMSGLPSLSEKLEKFLTLLRAEDDKLETLKPQIVNVLQDIVEIILQDSHGKSSSQHQRKRTEICQHRHQFYCQQISEGEGSLHK